MINIRPFKPKDFHHLLDLHRSQGYPNMGALIPETLPKIGYIASDQDTVVGIGFLRKVEGGFAQIDTLVTNSACSSELRHEAINKLAETLINTGKDLKLKGILVFTADNSILIRAEETGFRELPHSVLSLLL